MKNPARSFKDLIVWQKAHQFVLEIYRFTKDFPADERFGLTSQIRRAAVSVPANIAEGSSKSTKAHYKLYLENSLGSSYELETALIAVKKIYPALPSVEQYLDRTRRFKKC